MKVVSEAKSRIEEAKKESHITTGKVRKISAALYKEVEDKGIDNILKLSEELLQERSWALGVIAYDWAFRVRDQYTEKTFSTFEHWLKDYVRDWGDCDDFCIHALGALVSQYNHLFENVLQWTEHSDFWVRRGAAVSMIYPIKKDKYESINPLLVSDRLLQDDHYLVLKGYGWMLKVLSQQEPERVFEYLLKHKETMPRVAFRYGMEKLSKEKRETLMQKE